MIGIHIAYNAMCMSIKNGDFKVQKKLNHKAINGKEDRILENKI